MLEFRWLLEELRLSFFAQELRNPQPVSVKRLDLDYPTPTTIGNQGLQTSHRPGSAWVACAGCSCRWSQVLQCQV